MPDSSSAYRLTYGISYHISYYRSLLLTTSFRTQQERQIDFAVFINGTFYIIKYTLL